MSLNYTLKGARVAIAPASDYGYWERKDGSEGGGLWFDGKDLRDYDGAYELPAACIAQIEELGYRVSDDFR